MTTISVGEGRGEEEGREVEGGEEREENIPSEGRPLRSTW